MAFEDDVFSQDIRVGVKEDIKRHGLTIVIDEELPRNLSDMSSTLTKVKSLKPDVFLISVIQKALQQLRAKLRK
jgi:branched-chain amino acid transport system substrate-binding protein